MPVRCLRQLLPPLQGAAREQASSKPSPASHASGKQTALPVATPLTSPPPAPPASPCAKPSLHPQIAPPGPTLPHSSSAPAAAPAAHAPASNVHLKRGREESKRAEAREAVQPALDRAALAYAGHQSEPVRKVMRAAAPPLAAAEHGRASATPSTRDTQHSQRSKAWQSMAGMAKQVQDCQGSHTAPPLAADHHSAGQ